MNHRSKIFYRIKEHLVFLWGLRFTRDAFILQWGSFWDLGLSFIASVIYARLLGIDTYGDYALFFAFAGLVRLFMDWGTGYATLTLLSTAYAKRDRAEIKDILTYYFKLNFLVFGTIGLLALISAPYLADWFYHKPYIGDLARLIIIASFFQVFFSLLTSMLQVLRKMKYLVVAENIFKLSYILLPVSLVLLGYGLAGIAWGYMLAILGSMIFALAVYRQFARRNNLVPRLLEILFNFPKVKISKYFHYGFVMAVDNSVANSFNLLPLVILGYLASTSEVAALKIAVAYLALPNIFLTPVARLLQVQLPKAHIAGMTDLKHNFYQVARYAGVAYIFIILVALVFAPLLINLVYGSAFSLSAEIVYPLSLSVIFSGFLIGVGALYRTANKNLYSIIINCINLATGLILFYFVSKFFSPLVSIIVLIDYWAIYTLIVHLLYVRNYFNKSILNQN